MSTLPTPQDYIRDEQRTTGFGTGQVDGARSKVVNRTHRVIREQALTMQAQKKRSRSLWVPMIIFSSLMFVIVYAVWGVLEGYDELAPNGVPDASDQMMLLLLWSLPVTAVVLGLIWLKRSRSNANGEVQQ